MKISVITVCFNCENTIIDTIESVINQDFDDFEFIIVDGKSNDNTIKVIESYKNKINKLVSEKDNGIYDAINKGISLASGDIISLLHGNDVFSNSNVLSKVNNFFKLNNNIDLMIADLAFKKKLKNSNYIRYYDTKNFKPWMLRIGYSPPHLTTFYTKEALKKIGQYNISYRIAGDFDYFVKTFLINKLKFKTFSECLVFMSTGGLSNKNFLSYLISSYEINKSLKENGFYSNILLTFLRFPLKILQILKFK